MRCFVLLISALSLLAQPACGWQRIICSDGSPCPVSLAPSAPHAGASCCIPADSDSSSVVPARGCTVLSADTSSYVAPSAGADIHEHVLLGFVAVASDASLRKSLWAIDHELPQPPGLQLAPTVATRAPPLHAC